MPRGESGRGSEAMEVDFSCQTADQSGARWRAAASPPDLLARCAQSTVSCISGSNPVRSRSRSCPICDIGPGEDLHDNVIERQRLVLDLRRHDDDDHEATVRMLTHC